MADVLSIPAGLHKMVFPSDVHIGAITAEEHPDEWTPQVKLRVGVREVFHCDVQVCGDDGLRFGSPLIVPKGSPFEVEVERGARVGLHVEGDIPDDVAQRYRASER